MPSLAAMFSSSVLSSSSHHLWLTYGWLAVTGLAPVVLVLTLWAIGRQATFRSSWRPLDLLLAGLLVVQLPSTAGVLVLGAIKGTLVHLPRVEATRRLVCYLLVWATAAGRVYAVALLTALLADRAAILRWPYRYRFAVRHTQIRLFLALLAVVASLLGVAAVYGHWLKDEAAAAVTAMVVVGNQKPLIGSNQTSAANEGNSTTTLTSLMTLDAASAAASSLTTSTYRFTFDPATFDQRYNYISAGLYLFFAAFSALCTLYVECKRPRGGGSVSSSSSGSSSSGASSANAAASNGKNSRYHLPSIGTLFTVTATGGTGTGSSTSTTSSSSTSSSLSASGSPAPSRFSSLANLTANNGKQQQQQQQQQSSVHNQQLQQQQSNLPAFYYGGGKSSSNRGDAKAAEAAAAAAAASNTLNSLYPISIVDLMSTSSELMAIGPAGGGSSGGGVIGGGGFASMSTTTDNSIYRLIDGSGHHHHHHHQGSRSNSLSKDANESLNHHHHHHHHHRSTASSNHYQSDSAAAANCSSLDPLNPPTTGTNTATNTSSSRVNSFSTRTPSSSNVTDGVFTTQVGDNCGKLNLGDSFSAMTNASPHHHHHRSSAFDLRWSSVLGPVTFCLAFNHGPYLIFTILGLTVPGFWTPFHDLILAGLTLLEALLLPLIFTLCDEAFRGAVRRSCICVHVRRSDKISLGGGGGVGGKMGADSLPPPPSMAFGEIGGLRGGKSAFAPSALSPPYLHSPPTKSNALGLSDYQSELDLSKSVDKLKSSHHFSSRLNLHNAHHHPLHDHPHLHHLSSSSAKPGHATSMLDLSRSNGGTPYHHPHPHYQQQQQHGASRSRHSLALLQHLPPLFGGGGGSNSNTNSPTPRSSFRRRPPSVASYHYLLSSSPSTANHISSSKQNLSQLQHQQSQNQNQNNNNSRFPPPPQYLFGGVVPSKSETTLNHCAAPPLPLPLSSANYTPPMMMMATAGHHQLHQQQLKEIQEGHEMVGEAKSNNSSSQGPLPPPLSRQISEPAGRSSPAAKCSAGSPPPRLGKGGDYLGSGLISAARSSFKRRSVRKSGSDASTFFQATKRTHQHQQQQHLKRSQIAQSQLSSILYNNFYTKKATGLMNQGVNGGGGSALFGSQTTLLEDQNEFHHQQQQTSSPRMLATNLPARHLSYDFSQQSPAMLANSHVYLPNTSHLELLGARSNSCNQLSSVAEALGDYHNHLLMRPGGFSGLMNSEVGGYSGSPRVKSNELRGKHHDEAAEEEHIYASLPEEEEEEEEEEAEQNGAQSSRGSQQLCSSGSFSARSTLPDNCQLSSFRDGGDLQCGPAIVPQMSTFFNSKNAGSESQHQQRPSQSVGSTGSSPQSSGSSGADEECREDSGEDIYEEVAQLLPVKSSETAVEEQQRLARRSASQDTLTGGDNDNDEEDEEGRNEEGRNEEGDAEEEGDDDDDGDIEEDRVSMLSEASSSSTFSSFTTCANQDFEFTFVSSPTSEEQSPTSEVESTTLGRRTSQQKSATNSSAKVPPKLTTKTAAEAAATAPTVELQLENENSGQQQEQEQLLSPNTLSMAAMYYNRFILNEASGGNSSGKGGKGKSKGGSGSGHRQRPKVNRRQSFSTAYELRQRILTSQMSSGKGDHMNNHGGEMELIEEDEEGEDHNYQVHHNVDQFEDSGLLSYRLSRRISTSEDNLLSIISTMANCGDGEGAGGSGGSGNSSDHTTVNSSSSSSKSGSASSTPSKSSSTSSSAVTFVKREQQQQQQPSSRSGGGLYNKKQPRNQPNRAVPSSSSFSNSANPSSAIPRAANHANSATTTTTHATNISIKELKSKKKKLAQAQQAANSMSAANTAAAGAKADNFQLRPKSALNGNNGSGGDRIVELGSLWNRSTGATAAATTKTALPNGSSTAKTPPQPRFAATGKLLAAINNSTTTTTVTSGTSSSPSTPCRVPTFIPAPATRGSPAAAARGKLEQNGHNGLFASKLTPPSTYIGAGGNRAVKQNQARQNAILAKNALSGGGNGGEHERL